MSKLYLVPTPIGNLEDFTFRAIRVLSEVDLILAEDTRTSGKLLKHYDIETPARSHHAHNEHRTTNSIIEKIKVGESIALITDAGTPGISDPGFLLVRAAIEAGIEVECLPGQSAVLPALVVSGFPCDRFCFEGFLPPKKGRRKRLEAIAHEFRTTVLYESPHRILKLLTELTEYLPEERLVAVCRELTKLHEEIVRGNAGEVLRHFEAKKIRGEFVVVIQGA